MQPSSGQSSLHSAVGLERGDKVTRLEAFVDAAFAFSVTLLVVSGDHIPTSIVELIRAMKTIPAYAASFLMIMTFWNSHVRWSRRYGLDDTASQRLSLLLVFLVLIFVYPVKMVFATLFDALSGGYLPANFKIGSLAELPAMFVTFGVAFGLMGATMLALYCHAWRQRDALALTLDERAATLLDLCVWATVPLVATVSIGLALLIPAREESGWWLGAPGFVFFSLNVVRFGLPGQIARWRRKQEAA